MSELKAVGVPKQSTPAASGVLRRKCSGCKKKEKEKEKIRLQRTAVRSDPVRDVPPIVHEVLRSPGQPLGAKTRAFMEPRFSHDFSRLKTYTPPSSSSRGLIIGPTNNPLERQADQMAEQAISSNLQRNTPSLQKVDFSRVRVHTDAKAAESARAVNALAYTVGQHIIFLTGQYSPETSNGQRLLAHELVHTVQQADGLRGMLQRMTPCPPALTVSDPVPSGWKAYNGNSCWFHCCYRGILENRRPTPNDPQNECFYDDNGALVDEHHEDAGCRGTPNQYDSASDWWRHTFEDEGGIWSRGWGAFWSSRWRDLNQHFEREGQRMLECHEICNQQPWYLRGFCLEGCSGMPPMY